MVNRLPCRLLVSIPHAGVLCPGEISLETLSARQTELAGNIDWHTGVVYDFRDLLRCSQEVFPYSQVYINVNRHPTRIDECVPDELDGIPVYLPGRAPDPTLKRALVRRYHHAYHRRLATAGKDFILDAHSTLPGLSDAAGVVVRDDIILSDRQETPLDPPGGTRTAPGGWMELYAEALARQLPGVAVACNTTYCATYGHVMAAHGWDGKGPRGRRAPLLLQETSENLYMNGGVLDVQRAEELRRTFASALAAMIEKAVAYSLV